MLIRRFMVEPYRRPSQTTTPARAGAGWGVVTREIPLPARTGECLEASPYFSGTRGIVCYGPLCQAANPDRIMNISPLAGKPAPPAILVNVPRLVTAYYTEIPDAAISAQL